MPPGNKYIKLLDQGLAAFVYQRDDNGKPVLSDNPLMLGPWRDDLEDYLYEYDPKFVPLLTEGTLLDPKGGTIFSTYAQATDYSYGTMRRDHTILDPPTCPYVRPAEVQAKYDAMPSSAGFKEIDSSSLPSNMQVSHSHIKTASTSICTAICLTVPSRNTAKDFKTESKRDGFALLKHINQQVKDLIDDDAADAIEAAINAFFDRGLQSVTPSGFTDLADQVEMWNKIQVTTRVISEPLLASKYADLLRVELGKAEFRELKADLKDEGASGNLSITRRVIKKFLAKDTTIAMKDGLKSNGKMLKLGDPRMHEPAPGAAGGAGNGDANRKRTPQEREAAGEQPPGKCHCPSPLSSAGDTPYCRCQTTSRTRAPSRAATHA